ncbi:hypothetical protein MKEN_00783900 [Mycena kentingensis (nom. inval.)]|nr:hypothetical protein MKEN_00783900 [Mycena kentingensis (nom. inval.)]
MPRAANPQNRTSSSESKNKEQAMDTARQLHTKEKRSKTDRQQILFGDGKGRILTDDAIIEGLEREREQREARGAEKERRKQMRVDLGEKRRKCEEEWKVIQAAHKTAVDIWKKECENAREQGVRAKDLPPKPKKASLKRDLEVKWGLKTPEADADDDGEVARGLHLVWSKERPTMKMTS